jgi:hypothetical protein
MLGNPPKFMPKIPVRKDNGRKIVATIDSRYIQEFFVRLSDFEAHHATSRLVPLPSLGLQNNEQFYLPDIRGLGNPHRKGP